MLTFKPRLKIYKGCNGKVTFDPETGDGYSYGWWKVVRKIKGKWVFNWHSYSPTTRRHQYALSDLLKSTGRPVFFSANLPNGLQTFEREALRVLYGDLFAAEIKIANPRTTETVRKNMQCVILNCKKDIKTARSLGAVMGREDIALLKKAMYDDESERIALLKAKREAKKLAAMSFVSFADGAAINLFL